VEADVRSPEPVVELDDVLRDALSDLLAHETQYGPVVDAERRVVGVLSVELLAHSLQSDPDEVPRGADAAVAEASRPTGD
jgi:CBS-domain-containing membrane protein